MPKSRSGLDTAKYWLNMTTFNQLPCLAQRMPHLKIPAQETCDSKFPKQTFSRPRQDKCNKNAKHLHHQNRDRKTIYKVILKK
jgi:hypothetical protein